MNANSPSPTLSDDEYHADTSRISKSGLDLISRSPAHYWHRYLNPEAEERPETDALKIGKAAHCGILERDAFQERYYVLDDSAVLKEIGGARPRMTSKYKEWLAEAESLNEGKTRLDMAVYRQIASMRDAVMKHPSASVLLAEGIAEQSVFFQEPETGAPCKCRPDWLDSANGLIVDIKTTENASPEEFARSAYKYRYHVQAAFYMDGLHYSSADFIASGFVFIAVEKSPPYGVGVYFMDADAMALGRAEYMRDLESYMACRKSGAWPAYSAEIEPLRLPAWAYRKR